MHQLRLEGGELRLERGQLLLDRLLDLLLELVVLLERGDLGVRRRLVVEAAATKGEAVAASGEEGGVVSKARAPRGRLVPGSRPMLSQQSGSVGALLHGPQQLQTPKGHE